MKSIWIKAALLTAGLGLCLTGQAQMTAQDGLGKLKTNLDNSKANLTEYQKNLKVVEGNVGEVTKAKSVVEQQRTEVGQSLQENSQNLKKIEGQEGEINGLIRDEQTQLANEQARINEMEHLITQLKENQKKRQANILAYQEQLKQTGLEKQEWKGRTDKLAKTQSELNTRASTLAAQENEWKGKKRGYEGEVSRWKKEMERNQKLHENYSSLAESKD